MQCCNKVFFKLYPPSAKSIKNPEGQTLRIYFKIALILHIVLFIISLCMVGFEPMLWEIVLLAIAYSCYLTVREYMCIFYIMVLGASFINAMIKIWSYTSYYIKFFGYTLIVIFYGFNFYFISLQYWRFRTSGGIHGHQEQLIDK